MIRGKKALLVFFLSGFILNSPGKLYSQESGSKYFPAFNNSSYFNPSLNSPVIPQKKKEVKKVLDWLNLGIGYSAFRINNTSKDAGTYGGMINPGSLNPSGFKLEASTTSVGNISMFLEFCFSSLTKSTVEQTIDDILYSRPAKWNFQKYSCGILRKFSYLNSLVNNNILLFGGGGFGVSKTFFKQEKIVSGESGSATSSANYNSLDFIYFVRLKLQHGFFSRNLVFQYSFTHSWQETQLFKRSQEREFFNLGGTGFDISLNYRIPLRYAPKKKLRN